MQFWEMMGPNQTRLPSELASAIDDSFGSFGKFKDDFVLQELDSLDQAGYSL